MSKIRKAELSDNARITEILNQAIEAGNATAILNIFTPEERLGWLNEHLSGKYVVFVAELGNKVVGWLSLSPYRKGRQAFNHLAEITYYIDYNYQRKGIAGALFEKALQHCKKNGIEMLVAFLYASNIPSVKMLEKLGFERWGLFPAAIRVDSNQFDHVIYGINLKKDHQP